MSGSISFCLFTAFFLRIVQLQFIKWTNSSQWSETRSPDITYTGVFSKLPATQSLHFCQLLLSLYFLGWIYYSHSVSWKMLRKLLISYYVLKELICEYYGKTKLGNSNKTFSNLLWWHILSLRITLTITPCNPTALPGQGPREQPNYRMHQPRRRSPTQSNLGNHEGANYKTRCLKMLHQKFSCGSKISPWIGKHCWVSPCHPGSTSEKFSCIFVIIRVCVQSILSVSLFRLKLLNRWS